MSTSSKDCLQTAFQYHSEVDHLNCLRDLTSWYLIDGLWKFHAVSIFSADDVSLLNLMTEFLKATDYES